MMRNCRQVNRWIKFAVTTLAVLVIGAGAAWAQNSALETSAQRDARMQWWRDARFGMFIHWGIYAQAAGEWNGQDVSGVGEWIMYHGHISVTEYETLAPQFNPVKFDAAKWVSTAKDAGMKYIVITAKHHDGFCMFDSKLTPYDIVDATPFQRDPLKELAAECKKQNIKLCFYYSIMDWHHPDCKGERFPAYVEYMKGQLRELLTNYGEIGVLWFDGEWIDEWTEEQGRDLYAFCRGIQPSLIINNRVGKGRDGMKGLSKSAEAVGDFGTPEQEVPSEGLPGVDWETCMTMNDTWGFKKSDQHWKSSEVLIGRLREINGKGGNFLLNVGPTALGEIPEPSVERLAAMGAWVGANPQPAVALLAVQSGESKQKTAPTAGGLTPAEIAAGWKLLFDGQNIDAWKGYRQQGWPKSRWTISDGTIQCVGGEGATFDLMTVDEYGDFELTLEFKTALKANSGIIYRATEKHDAAWQTGPEFQILDDTGVGLKPDDGRSCGAMYDLFTPAAAKVLKPAGEFNQARIYLRNNQLEHWLNGVKVVECDLNTDDWTSRIAKSKFKDYEGFGVQPRGHIVLQDHGDVVSYRNIRIRDLDAKMPGEISLFDGKTMNGWTYKLDPDSPMDKTWSVQDGAIICAGNPAGYIRTEKDYTNFVLKLQWRFSPVTKKAGNSGVLVRMVGEDKVWPKSVEAQLMSGNAGDFFSIENFPMKADPARSKGRHVARMRTAERPVGEWNEYEIIVDHGNITLKVNGDTVNHAWDVEEVSGKICLQSEGAEIHFKNIRLAPIP